MKIAFQMDPIQSVNINADSTFRIAEEAQGHQHPRQHQQPAAMIPLRRQTSR